MDKGHAHAYTRSARPRRRPPTVPRRLLGLRSVQRGDRPPARRARLRQTRLRQLHPVQDVPGDALRQLLRPGPAKGNAAVYDALVGVGLLRRDGDSYDLTPAGREDYKPESKAFCYSSGFDVSVRSVDPAKPDDYGPAVEKGWLVTVEVKPREVKDWAKNPEVLKQASLTTLQQITQPQVGQVSLVKPRGEEGYKLVNTRFSPRQGFHFNQAW